MNNPSSVRLSALFSVALICLWPGISIAGEVKVGSAAIGDWHDDAPGVRRHIGVSDLPAPSVERDTSNSPDVIKMPKNAKPAVLSGFEVELVASEIKSPRTIRVAPNGDLFVADSKTDQVLILRSDGSTFSKPQVFAGRLHQPYGIA